MTIREYAFATVDAMGSRPAYEEFCAHAGLRPHPLGYGLLLCEDEAGARWTAVGDVEYTRAAVEGSQASVARGLELSAERYPLRREGWPDEW